jgi:hypothetical protein
VREWWWPPPAVYGNCAWPRRARAARRRTARYLYLELRGKIYFLFAYAKNERVDLSPADK